MIRDQQDTHSFTMRIEPPIDKHLAASLRNAAGFGKWCHTLVITTSLRLCEWNGSYCPSNSSRAFRHRNISLVIRPGIRSRRNPAPEPCLRSFARSPSACYCRVVSDAAMDAALTQEPSIIKGPNC